MRLRRRTIVAALGLAGLLGLVSACTLPKPSSAQGTANAFIIAARKSDTAAMCKLVTPNTKQFLRGGCASLDKLYLDIITDLGHPAYRAGDKAAPPGARSQLHVNNLEIDGDTAGGAISAAFPTLGRLDPIQLRRIDGTWKVELYPEGAATPLLVCRQERIQLISARDTYLHVHGHLPTHILDLIKDGLVPMRSLHVDLLPNGTVSAAHDCT